MYPEHTVLPLELVQLHKHGPGHHQQQLHCRSKAGGLAGLHCPILSEIAVQGLNEGPVRQQHTCVQDHIQPHSTCIAKMSCMVSPSACTCTHGHTARHTYSACVILTVAVLCFRVMCRKDVVHAWEEEQSGSIKYEALQARALLRNHIGYARPVAALTWFGDGKVHGGWLLLCCSLQHNTCYKWRG